jgi:hypothetical protein
MTNTNPSSVIPTLKITEDLTRVSGVLQDMQAAEEIQPMSPSIPPAAFVAGGPL